MKHLFGTVDLEAEIFETKTKSEETDQEIEYILGDGTAEDYAEIIPFLEQNIDDFPALELKLELVDGRTLEYEVLNVFVHDEKEYIGLHPKSDTDGLIHIMQMTQGEDDEIELHPIKEEEELKAVYQTFFRVYEDDYETESRIEETSDEAGKKTLGTSRSKRFHVR